MEPNDNRLLQEPLPDQEASQDVRLEKYCKGDETRSDDVYSRVSKALVQPEAKNKQKQLRALFWQCLQKGFIPAGRVLSAAGVDLKATLINCFVQQIGDTLTGEHGDVPGIYDALAKSAETLRRGGGVGYDFSRIRPKSAFVKGTLSRASGPISFMQVFDESCKQIESAGARRGAQMGVLRIDHPDIVDFVKAKRTPGAFTQFNLSVAVTDHFIESLNNDNPFELVHVQPPFNQDEATQNDDGLWVYDTIDPRELWDLIIGETYDHAEPGVLFVDRANADNNLWYCETFEATNPCAEQWLPPYGCCCLGSINLTRFIEQPFTDDAQFDFAGFSSVVQTSVRMLDNVLDVTAWPLPEQAKEAASKRRVGLGFTGLGNALTMLGIPYDSEDARAFAAEIACVMRDDAYRASVELAAEKGPFALFDADKYLQSEFTSRLPEDIREAIRTNGIRNSHLLSIAPTGTISLAMADNASNGIEPAFMWAYTRKKRMNDGTHRFYPVVDHAFRRYCNEVKGVDPAFADEDTIQALQEDLPEGFVGALEISAQDHLGMLSAVQPFIDSSISKTVNVPEEYPFEDFKDLYSQAAESGLKGLATYRPNSVTGAVLSETPSAEVGVELDQPDADRRLQIDKLPEPVLNSLKWPNRPDMPAGNPAWTYMVKTAEHHFALFVGQSSDPSPTIFEVWVNGAEQPRGLGAIAKAISMDMRSNDRTWLFHKLDSLERAKGDDGFVLRMPPDGQEVRVPSLVSGFAQLIKSRLLQVEGEAPEAGQSDLLSPLTPMMDALMSEKEPKTGPDGTMSWSVDVLNPATDDDFLLSVKELRMPDGQRRPYSIWMSGEYPRVFDGLCKVLSYDMRILDPAWIGAKLRSLRDFSEPRGDFWAKIPGKDQQQVYPSTVAYVCALLIHRFRMLGILDENGFPLQEVGLMDDDYHNVVALKRAQASQQSIAGKTCVECHVAAVIRKDGCDWCSNCGATGACG